MRLYSPVENRVFGLDLMRAVAILVVLLAHSQYLVVEAIGLPWIPLFDGVDLFFVLSGFLIGGILLRTFGTEGIGVRQTFSFWRRRWLRTLPNYYLFLTLNLIVSAFIFPYAFGAFDAPFLIFSQNLIPFAANHAFFPEAWSLSVEEWFYLATPLLIIACSLLTESRNIRIAAGVAGLLIVVASTIGRGTIFDPATLGTFKSLDENMRKIVVFRLDSLAVGLIGALARQTRPDLWLRARVWLMVIGIVLVVSAVTWEQHIWVTNITWGYSTFYSIVLSLGFLCVLPALDSWKSASGPLARFITFTSLISYSLYLVHYSLLVMPMQLFWPAPGRTLAVFLFAGFWVVSYGLATLNYRFFESQVLVFRDGRLSDRHRPGIAAPENSST